MVGVRRARLKLGESAAIFGLGLLGQMAGMLCRLNGAFPVMGLDLSPFRLELAAKSGFDAVINPNETDILEKVQCLTKGRMVDCVFEVTGNSNIIEQEMGLLHEQGKFILMGSPRGKTTIDFQDFVNRPSHSIIGAHNCSHPPVATLGNPWTIVRDVELFFDLLVNDRIEPRHLITNKYAAREAPAAYDKLLKDRSHEMGVILDWA